MGIVNAAPPVSKSVVGVAHVLESVAPEGKLHDGVDPDPVNPFDVTRKLKPAPPMMYCTQVKVIGAEREREKRAHAGLLQHTRTASTLKAALATGPPIAGVRLVAGMYGTPWMPVGLSVFE